MGSFKGVFIFRGNQLPWYLYNKIILEINMGVGQLVEIGDDDFCIRICHAIYKGLISIY